MAILIGAPLWLSAAPALSVEQTAGQFLGTTLAGLTRDDELDLWLGDRGVALIVLYRDEVEPRRNSQIREALARHARPDIRPLLAIDQEGGIVVRYAAGALPSAMALGAAGSEALAWRAGWFTACSLRTLGIDANFAPVLDLSSPAESGIGTRSFGRDPAAVAILGSAFIRGASRGGVLSVVKHYPGQGFADADPHFGLSRSFRTASEMSAQDLVPFRAAIAAGAAGLMTAHVTYPSWKTAGDAPASLSRPLLQTLLRDELRFEGLVVTDAIQMGGLGRDLESGELAVRAIEAGADIVLAPSPLERDRVYRSVLAAIRSGRISKARVDRTLARLRAARAEAVQPGFCPADASPADEIARAAVTRIGGAPAFEPASSFFIGAAGELADRFPAERRHLVPTDPPLDAQYLEVPLEGMRACGPVRVIAAIQNRSQAALVRAVFSKLETVPRSLIVLGSPYDAAGISADEYVFTYGSHEASMQALLDVLEGRSDAPGRLPVDVEGVGVMGEGEPACEVSSGARGSR